MNTRELCPQTSNSFCQLLAAATRPLRLLGLSAVMFGLLGSTMALHAASGNQNDQGTGASIVGTWIIEVSFGGANCSPGDIVQYSCSYGLLVFHPDGTMSEVDTLIPPSQQSWGAGVWRQTGSNSFATTFEQLQFDSAGNPANYDVVWGPVKLSSDGKTFTSSGGFASYNFDNSLITTPGYSGTFTTVGKRMKLLTSQAPEPLP